MKCVRECADLSLIENSIDLIQKKELSFVEISGFYKAIGNATRLKLIYLIQKHRVCVCDLSDILNMSVSAVSQQLSKLGKVGIVENVKEKQTIFYSISPKYNTIINSLINQING